MLKESLKLLVENNKAVLKFEGEVIFDNSNQLKEEAKQMLSKNEGVNKLVIDLANVSYLDSSGVGLILSLFKFMRNKKGTLAVAAANEKIKRVFEVTKLQEIIPVYAGVEEAMEEEPV
ncbi:SpoIIAA-like anti-anti-sigma regulatory factor [Halanaerobium saccharolyticum]|uniref:Anti-sigma factor antagonist n=1 Tax=Halanaerobium saccharolyticum TaxID=43595 RepID=A0A4R7Z103_9FIRM|nr:STAS domain-containing protein [Halanaerobium saccharolyticum]RAK08129.1 SpoIIAA-like anti-anti-sigma regulatory factor [Halanaerobium saccharolyticum]TDW04336.1 SpoIIAA-like anti-anti-sigma regulatory factor [Halanaerobium saccharolyticum]TDX59627.1 SpoIIAA-like anti-anti-sigma regulatory factor [Halanaerobium saccharolyticum]